MMNGNIFRVTGHLCGEFTGHRWIPRTKASEAELGFFFDLRLNKRLSKQSWGWWFQATSRSLWRHCNVLALLYGVCLVPSMISVNRAYGHSWHTEKYNKVMSVMLDAVIWLKLLEDKRFEGNIAYFANSTLFLPIGYQLQIVRVLMGIIWINFDKLCIHVDVCFQMYYHPSVGPEIWLQSVPCSFFNFNIRQKYDVVREDILLRICVSFCFKNIDVAHQSVGCLSDNGSVINDVCDKRRQAQNI